MIGAVQKNPRPLLKELSHLLMTRQVWMEAMKVKAPLVQHLDTLLQRRLEAIKLDLSSNNDVAEPVE